MIINHNMPSMNTLRQMGVNQANAQNNMQKLSSGLRINKAGDDAAGLAISEKMRAQIRGLDQASRNSQDGISLLQTAEGGLSESQSILQRMRELAVQSASDTQTSDDRKKIQVETDQLAKEVTRISNTTEFNNQSLLNGAIKTGKVGEMTFQIGANAGQNISVSINAMDAKSLGVSRDALTSTLSSSNASGANIESAEADNGINSTEKLTAGDYVVKVTNLSSGAVSGTVTGSGTIATGFVSGTPSVDTSVTLTYTAAVSGGATLGSGTVTDASFAASGVTSGFITVSGTGTVTAAGSYQLSMTDATHWQLQVDNGAGYTNVSGATGSVSSGASSVAISGLSITLKDASGLVSGAAYATGNTFKFTVAATASAGWTASGAATGLKSTTGTWSVNNISVDMSKLTSGTTGSSVTITGTSAKSTVQLFDSSGSTTLGDQVKMDQANGGTYTIGNSSGKMSVTFAAGGATSGSSTVTVSQTSSTAATFASAQKSNDAVASAGIDVSTQGAANLAIGKINKAITTVSEERSKLGAYQNRLEHTINNLNTSSENLTAAESRIRDVDMAKEMSEFSKNNILSQAAQAMLSQANQAPQQVLSLLR